MGNSRQQFERQAVDIADTRRRVADLASAPQLARSSFNAGPDQSIDELDPVTGLPVASFGTQYDGTHGAVPLTSPTPPTPTIPALAAQPGLLAAAWDGFYVDTDGVRDEMIVAPLGFGYAEVHVAPVEAGEGFDARTTATLAGTINTARGGGITVATTAGDYWVRLVVRSTAGKPSEPGQAALITVPQLVNTTQLELDLGTAQETLAAAQERLDAAEQDLALTFTTLEAVPGQISTAKGEAIQAAAADATEKANAAETAATLAAAADAAAQAATAEANATAAAATDAQARADAARQAAIDSAAATAAGLATAAETAAKQAAATDAQTRADTAKAAAVAAAATDAQTRASAAEAAAILAAATDATTKANKALADAKADATTKAGQALADAKTDAAAKDALVQQAAAADATEKADAAKTLANTAQADATKALADALAASGLAGTKGEVIYQLSAPTGTRAVAQNLWIRSSDNKPHRWNVDSTATNKWEAVTDKAATDAATAAGAAQTKANEAATAAATAQTRADNAYTLAGTANTTANSALTSANGKTKVYRSLSAPSGSGGTAGDIWWRYADNTWRLVIGEWTWDGGSWETQKQGHQTIASVDIGALTVVGTATISNAVAAKIAAGTASIQTADIGNLTVTGTSTMASLVAEKIAAQTGQFMYLTAQQIDVNQLWADLAFSNQARTHLLSVLSNTDGSGYTSTVTGQGLRVTFTEKDAAGNVVQVQDIIRLGTFGDDRLALYKNNVPTFVATAEGDVSGRSGAFNELRVAGETLTAILAKIPRGHVSAAIRTSDQNYNSIANNPAQPYLRLDVELEEGRLYKIWTSPIRLGISAGGRGIIQLHFENGGAATTASPRMNYVEVAAEGLSAIMQELYSPNVANAIPGRKIQCSFLISNVTPAGSGQSGIRANPIYPVRLEVEDIGPVLSTGNGVHLVGAAPTAPAPTPPPALVTYQKDWGFTQVRTYLGEGGEYTWPHPRGAQGLSPAGYGNLNSLWIFPSLASELSGAIIHDVWAFFHFDQWFYGAGGTARIGLHGWLGAPANNSGNPTWVAAASGGWPAGQGRWVRIPENHYGGFANGTYKGFSLLGDGTYETYGIARESTLRIRYSK